MVRVCGCSCPTACHANEISPCPSPCLGGKARGQDEDEMAPPQKIPQSCSLHCGWERPRTLVCFSRSTFPARTALLGCLIMVLCGNISRASTCNRRRLPRRRRRGRGPSSQEARPRRLGRGVPCTIGHEEFTILRSNVWGFISRVAGLSALLGLKPRRGRTKVSQQRA